MTVRLWGGKPKSHHCLLCIQPPKRDCSFLTKNSVISKPENALSILHVVWASCTQCFVIWLPLTHCSEVSGQPLPYESPGKHMIHPGTSQRWFRVLLGNVSHILAHKWDLWNAGIVSWLWPSLNTMPMHWVVFICKDVFDSGSVSTPGHGLILSTWQLLL